MPVYPVTRSYVCSRLHRTFPPGCSSFTTAFGSITKRTSAPLRGAPSGAIRRVMDSPCLSAAGFRFLRLPAPAVELARSCDGVTGACQTTRGYHVPHRQETSGELASLRRELGTVSTQ